MSGRVVFVKTACLQFVDSRSDGHFLDMSTKVLTHDMNELYESNIQVIERKPEGFQWKWGRKVKKHGTQCPQRKPNALKPPESFMVRLCVLRVPFNSCKNMNDPPKEAGVLQ